MDYDGEENLHYLGMIIESAITKYLDDIEDLGIPLAVLDGDQLFIDSGLILDVTQRAALITVEQGHDDPRVAIAIMAQCLLDTVKVLTLRHADITPEHIFSDEDEPPSGLDPQE